jgi:hypothetical protein
MRACIERWWFGRDPIVGIDIREDSVICADVDLRGTTRRLTIDSQVSPQGDRRVLGDTALFTSKLRDFIVTGSYRIERCAVGLPESFTYISWVTLPKEMFEKPERVRYEAALERIYLRPQDVRGRMYSLSGVNSPFLVVASKVADVEPLEDAIRSLGVELTCLTPRVCAINHLIRLCGAEVTGDLVAYCDLSGTSSRFHLFRHTHYLNTFSEWSDILTEIDRVVDFGKGSSQKATLCLIVQGDRDKEDFLQHRHLSCEVAHLREVTLLGRLRLGTDLAAASALSLWEVRRA